MTDITPHCPPRASTVTSPHSAEACPIAEVYGFCPITYLAVGPRTRFAEAISTEPQPGLVPGGDTDESTIGKPLRSKSATELPFRVVCARPRKPAFRRLLRFEPFLFAQLFHSPDFAAPARIFITALFVRALRQNRRHLEFAPMAVDGHKCQVSAAHVTAFVR